MNPYLIRHAHTLHVAPDAAAWCLALIVAYVLLTAGVALAIEALKPRKPR